MVQFNYYANRIKNSNVAGTISLDRFYNAIKYPKKRLVDLFHAIQRASEANDQELRGKLKTGLYSFTPAVEVFPTRAYSSIQNWTGLMPLDFDKLKDHQLAKEFKEYLFQTYPFIRALWFSASGLGVRGFAAVPVCNSVDEYKERFAAIVDVLGIYNGFDPAPKNCVLPLFQSIDRDILIRHDFELFTDKKKVVLPPLPVYNYFPDSTQTESKIVRFIERKIDSVSDFGHPIVRATAYTLGGYIAAGEIAESVAMDVINRCIEHHHYLQKKKEIYKRTVRDMILKGKKQPLSFNV
jgi:hypothetical protein